MASSVYSPLLQHALRAVQAAGLACARIQSELSEQMKVQKADRSPVTVADFTSQAIICRGLHQADPGTPIVAEEGTGALRMSDQQHIRAQIVSHLSAAFSEPVSEEQALKWIDLGATDTKRINGHAGEKVFWTLDPIDGTKGFIRGEQYAVCLALIAGPDPVLAVMACPNLVMGGVKGVLAFAARGKGAWMIPLAGVVGQAEPVRLTASTVTDPTLAVLTKSVESGHSDQPRSVKIAAALGAKPEPITIDSQAKYAMVAGGAASFYMRLPMSAEYHEYIWDHAAGVLLVTEAGGRVADVAGKPLDFSRGSTLLGNRGVIASAPGIFKQVLAAVKASQ
jgi:3'(2'), 5'-bisphosphate nucleotidase